jgi:16S rRNA C1402 (ribose-2'-O) methylase RsmI
MRTLLQGREIKGEVALLVAGRSAENEAEEEQPLVEEIKQLEAEGLSLKEIAQLISERGGIAKREVYALGVRLREGK